MKRGGFSEEVLSFYSHGQLSPDLTISRSGA